MSETLHFDTARFMVIAARFNLGGRVNAVAPFGSGHINDTYLCTAAGAGAGTRWVLQRINHLVFKRPDLVMENIARITSHIARRAQQAGENPGRATLHFVPADSGSLTHREPDGTWWRVCGLVENSRSYDVPETLEQTRAAAAAFGTFQYYLGDLNGPRLHDTIPGFHDTPQRLQALRQSIERDSARRAAQVREECAFVLSRQPRTGRLQQLLAEGRIPERITHNDTKLNNVLFDTANGRALCVIDLDTVMPGMAPHDFGDMVRVGASAAAEDEPDTRRVKLDIERFRAMAAGYLEGVRGALLPAEVEHLAYAAWCITLEQAARFLADYLDGDVYYKISHPSHNIQRCRAQLALVSDMERRMGDMERALTQGR